MIAAHSNTVLSSGLSRLADMFDQPRAKPVAMNDQGRRHIVAQLRELQRLAVNLETELHTFRLIEVDHAGRRFLEQEAAQALRDGGQDSPATGNVFRPDFGRRS